VSGEANPACLRPHPLPIREGGGEADRRGCLSATYPQQQEEDYKGDSDKGGPRVEEGKLPAGQSNTIKGG